jgi:hypothetical protein
MRGEGPSPFQSYLLPFFFFAFFFLKSPPRASLICRGLICANCIKDGWAERASVLPDTTGAADAGRVIATVPRAASRAMLLILMALPFIFALPWRAFA